MVASFLIYLKNAAEPYFERLFGTPTGLNFEHTALLYDFAFHKFETMADFKYESLSQFGSHIYEIITERDSNQLQHQTLYQKLGTLSMLHYNFHGAQITTNNLIILLHGFISDHSSFMTILIL